MKTELNDRILWWDGVSEVSADRIVDLLLAGADPSHIVVRTPDSDIELFNQLSEEVIPSSKEEIGALDFRWKIPLEFAQLDLRDFVSREIERRASSDPVIRANVELYRTRAAQEMAEIDRHGLGMIFKTLMYVVHVLKDRKQIWGVGRGSSCASLVLNLIGIHEVDPIRFNIPMEEFFHD